MATAALTCDDVEREVSPCVTHVNSMGKKAEVECCKGARTLNKMAQTPADHREACKCIKNILHRMRESEEGLTGEMESFAGTLPGKCGAINVPYKISLSTNCDD
ncbi:Plant lipid transfer protein/Par allergen [Corchorus olitorius]|uniref:Plant lipid transfer protein/Par allergen n=1 Tax=Corchorus olitorius TaxID=93759 RepID=A0A1R3J2M9_9ROSI|nr:Plant lipid transfer protein/Par allergen [Corchorus olitorius]